MSNLLSKFAADESGAGAVEYALVLLLALAVVVAITPVLKAQVTAFLTGISPRLTAGLSLIS